jgi:hypothetical protein
VQFSLKGWDVKSMGGKKSRLFFPPREDLFNTIINVSLVIGSKVRP